MDRERHARELRSSPVCLAASEARRRHRGGSALAPLGGSPGVDGERMDAVRELPAERIVYQAVPGDTVSAFEDSADDEHAEVRLRASRYGVLVALVDHLEPLGYERRLQALFDASQHDHVRIERILCRGTRPR